MVGDRPPIVDGKFLLGSNDARWGNIRIQAHRHHHGLADVLDCDTYGGKRSTTTEAQDVAAARRRSGMDTDDDTNG